MVITTTLSILWSCSPLLCPSLPLVVSETLVLVFSPCLNTIGSLWSVQACVCVCLCVFLHIKNMRNVCMILAVSYFVCLWLFLLHLVWLLWSTIVLLPCCLSQNSYPESHTVMFSCALDSHSSRLGNISKICFILQKSAQFPLGSKQTKYVWTISVFEPN